MRGFQLWINLPAKDKMKPASYRDLDASDIPEVKLGDKGKVRVIAGNYAGTVRISSANRKPAEKAFELSLRRCIWIAGILIFIGVAASTASSARAC